MTFHQDPAPYDLGPASFRGSIPKEAQLARGERRYKRRVGSAKTWARIIDAKQGPCRICEFVRLHPAEAAVMGLTLAQCQGEPISYHHLVDRAHGGSDCEANIVPVGGSGTTGHHGMVTRRHKGACAALRRMLTSRRDTPQGDEYSYVVEKLGEGGFEARYPVAYVCVNPEAAYIADLGRSLPESANQEGRRG